MSDMLSRLDVGVLRKYDRPGPRYTSYPAAPLFTTEFTAEQYRDAIRAGNGPDGVENLSLYFHFPFCDTLCYFCGCTMMVTRDRGRIQEYLEYLKKEIDLVAGMISPKRRVTQIHWGGGTPTHLSADQIKDIGGYILRKFQLSPTVEMSVEVDPRELTRNHLEALRGVGFHRISIGVQDFNPAVQKAVNRVQSEELTSKVLAWARDLNFTSINIDLIYGLPLQTPGLFHSTVRAILRFHPDRIALFNYAHVPWLKPHQKLIRQEDLPSPETKLEILRNSIGFLALQGYEYIGMDHFARSSDELAIARRTKTLNRNFQGYSTRAGADLYGLGLSSISHFGIFYAQNAKNLQEYYAALEQGLLPTRLGYTMTRDDEIRKTVIMRLMCDLEVSIEHVNRMFDISFTDYFEEALHRLGEFVEDGLVQRDDECIRIVGNGRLVMRNIAMCFDAYLDNTTKSKPIYSRTI